MIKSIYVTLAGLFVLLSSIMDYTGKSTPNLLLAAIVFAILSLGERE